MAESLPTVAETPDSNISPKSQPTPKKDSYFPADKNDGAELSAQTEQSTSRIIEVEAGAKIPEELMQKGKDEDAENDSDASATTPGDTAPSLGSTSEPPSRKMSISSVTFQLQRDPSLPQGLKKKPMNAARRRDASPPPITFRTHVAFDNVPLGEPTESNPISFTLNAKHAGYQSTKKSRTFMVGVDDNAYSDHALQWLLDEMVDDGDEVICVRVIETQLRLTNTAYKEAADALMKNIQAKNTKNLAISLVLEYAVGKLHMSFQALIKIYQPSMLIVGTKGRSLDSVSSVVFNRSSFSKYCLQYSPVPVVVVRPTEKREKKRLKRAQDPARQSYKDMLLNQKHEADSENSSMYELEPNISAAEEAHRVVVANGLPAKYDPTLKPFDTDAALRYASGKSRHSQAVEHSSAEASALAATGRLPEIPKGDESESEFEEEFETTSGEQALRKERLHAMESNEGAVLKEMQRKASADSSSESDDGEGGARTKNQ